MTQRNPIDRLSSTPDSSTAEVKSIKYPAGTTSSAVLDDLSKRGCIDLENIAAPDLTTPIIPLFSAPNFPSLSKKEYAWLEPALRLASHFVSDETTHVFFFHLQHDAIVSDYRDGNEITYLHADETIDVKEKLRRKKETQSALGRLARGLKVVKLTEKQMDGEEVCFEKAFLEDSSKSSDAVSNFRIGLHPDVFAYIKDACKSKDGKLTSQDLRVCFLLARTLVRNSARFFFHFIRGTAFGEAQEPYWMRVDKELDEEANLADDWEIFALGCKVQLWNEYKPQTPKEKKYGKPPVVDNARSVFLHSTNTDETGIDRELMHTTILPMTWVQAWFQQAAWTEMHKNGREIGRPFLGHSPILLGTGQVKGEVEWTLERYTHEELMDHGGFNPIEEEDVEWLYGRVGGESKAEGNGAKEPDETSDEDEDEDEDRYEVV